MHALVQIYSYIFRSFNSLSVSLSLTRIHSFLCCVLCSYIIVEMDINFAFFFLLICYHLSSSFFPLFSSSMRVAFVPYSLLLSISFSVLCVCVIFSFSYCTLNCHSSLSLFFLSSFIIELGMRMRHTAIRLSYQSLSDMVFCCLGCFCISA